MQARSSRATPRAQAQRNLQRVIDWIARIPVAFDPLVDSATGTVMPDPVVEV
jgi:hypothetical protein